MRKNGYREQALALAETFAPKNNPTETNLHDWVIKIYIEDFPKLSITDKTNYQRALYHIESLDREVALKFMLQYGKVLVTELPQRATNVLIRLCCHYAPIPSNQPLDERRTFIVPEKRHLIYPNSGYSDDANHNTNDFTRAADYIFAFADQPYWLMIFLEVCTDYMSYCNKGNFEETLRDKSESDSLCIMYNTLLELYLKALKLKQIKSEHVHWYVEQALPSSAPTLPLTHQLSPATPTATTTATINNKEDEMVYRIYPVIESQLNDSNHEKVEKLIKYAKYDEKHALVLCQAKNFEFGILHLYERLNLKYDIIQYFMDKKVEEQDLMEKYNNILDRCREYGDADPNMWIQVLTYFVSGTEESRFSDLFVDKVLTAIKDKDVLPPLLVVQILSQNKKIELKTIKDYLSKKLSKEQVKIREQNTTISELQKETTKLKSDINELRTSAKIFQLTQCSFCNKQLDLPAVHFMCMHSYHQRCLEYEECFKCAKKNKEYLQDMRSKQRNKVSAQPGEDQSITDEEKRDSFFKLLDNAKQGFETVAKQFGTGLFPAGDHHDKSNK
ncbi:hypothetical protein AKO1_008574 [Acrasis kona]|uniref:RING-type domain-containing protein n=1 Tax=Acrasis kona TaxID=1008807 RepID=A0AAW2YLG0_9EUKA